MSAKDIEQYLKDCAPNYNPRTLQRRIIAFRQWHKLKPFSNGAGHRLFGLAIEIEPMDSKQNPVLTNGCG